MVDEPQLVLVEVEHELMKSLRGNTEMILSQTDKREHKRCLLPDLINQNLFAPELLERDEDECVWDVHEEQGIHEDEGDPEDIVVDGDIEGHHLVVGVGVVA